MKKVLKLKSYMDIFKVVQKNKYDGALEFDCCELSEIEFERCKDFLEGFTSAYETDYTSIGRTLTIQVEPEVFWPNDHFEPAKTVECKLARLSDKEEIKSLLSGHVKSVIVDMTELSEEDAVKCCDYIAGISEAIYASFDKKEERVFVITTWKKPMFIEAKKDYKTIEENHKQRESLYRTGFKKNYTAIEKLYKENIDIYDKYHIKSREELEYIEFLCQIGHMGEAIQVFDDFCKRYWKHGMNEIGLFMQVDRLLRSTYSDEGKLRNAIDVYNKLIEYMKENDKCEYLSFVYNFLAYALVRIEGEVQAAKEVIEDTLEIQANADNGKVKLISEILQGEIYYQMGMLQEALDVAEHCMSKLDITNKSEAIVYKNLERFASEHEKHVGN